MATSTLSGQRRAMAAPRWAVAVTSVLSVVGFGVSIYLTYVHFSGAKVAACPVSTHIDCQKVITSSYSVIFGIPVPVYGLAFFVGMLALCSPWAWAMASPLVARLRVASTVIGIGMVLWLVYVELYRLDTICLWCTSVHVITFVLFVTVALATANAGLATGNAGLATGHDDLAGEER